MAPAANACVHYGFRSLSARTLPPTALAGSSPFTRAFLGGREHDTPNVDAEEVKSYVCEMLWIEWTERMEEEKNVMKLAWKTWMAATPRMGMGLRSRGEGAVEEREGERGPKRYCNE